MTEEAGGARPWHQSAAAHGGCRPKVGQLMASKQHHVDRGSGGGALGQVAVAVAAPWSKSWLQRLRAEGGHYRSGSKGGRPAMG